MNALTRLAVALTKISERYVPSAFSIACILTLIVFGLGLSMDGQTPVMLVEHWGDGFWKLIPFAMQMCLILMTGSILADSPLMRRGLDAASKLLRKLAQAYPDRAEVFRRLGEAYARGGRSKLAVQAYTRAVDLEPFDVSTRRALAESLLLTGDLRGADREVMHVLAEDPDDVDAGVIQAAILLRRGATDDAIDRLDSLMAQRVNHVAGHYWLGEALMIRHRYEEAVVVYERLIEMRPDLASAREQLQTACRMLQRTKGPAEP